MSFIKDYLSDNYSLIAIGLVVLLLLIMKPKVAMVDFRPMYITFICIILCSILDKAETLASYDAKYYTIRLILSVLCYWLRPMFCMGVIFVIVTEKKKRILITIPEIINIIIMGLAFIPGIREYVFYFGEENYRFYRGILGYTVFIVGFIYLIILQFLVFFKLREKMAKETILIAVSAVSIMISTILESMGRLQNTTPKLVMSSCIIYYLMIYIQLTSVDALTGLYNRETFYNDLKKKSITAIASIDMNGLKELNDTKGHKAGDIALENIAKAIQKNTGINSRGYRIGGDEFIIIFKKFDEEKVRNVCDKIKINVEKSGQSIAIGYAISNGENPEELVNLSDERMYADKQDHYGRVRSKN